MNTLVVYDSQYGNTERVALAIAEAFRSAGQARAVRIDPARPLDMQTVDILIAGCPTQSWRPTAPLQTFLASLSPERLRDVEIACFDTRFRQSRWLTGSAARVMARMLEKRGARLLAPPESFFVKNSEGPLDNGELERASAWAKALASAVGLQQTVP